MDEIYGIKLAKTEFREAYNTGDVDRLLAVFNPDGFTDMSEDGPSKYGPEARARLSVQTSKLFSEYSVKLTPTIIDIAVLGNTAYCYGWHEFTLRSKNGGEPIRKRHRYSNCGGKLPRASGRSHFISRTRMSAKSLAVL